MTESMQDLIDQGFKIAAVSLKEGILDFGRPANVLSGNKYLLDYKNISFKSASSSSVSIVNSFIKDPIIVGKNTRIVNSVIGPYVSIGEECVIENTIVSNCVIEGNTVLKRLS